MKLILAWLTVSALALGNLALAFHSLGPATFPAALVIAATMAAIVAASFMKLGEGLALNRVFAIGALFWLVIMFGLAGADYATRMVIDVN